MDKRLARLFRNRWDAVKAIEGQEQQTAPLDLRWKQLNSLYQLGHERDLIQPERDEDSIQQLWARLKGA